VAREAERSSQRTVRRAEMARMERRPAGMPALAGYLSECGYIWTRQACRRCGASVSRCRRLLDTPHRDGARRR
jgi:hypothetical protein